MVVNSVNLLFVLLTFFSLFCLFFSWLFTHTHTHTHTHTSNSSFYLMCNFLAELHLTNNKWTDGYFTQKQRQFVTEYLFWPGDFCCDFYCQSTSTEGLVWMGTSKDHHQPYITSSISDSLSVQYPTNNCLMLHIFAIVWYKTSYLYLYLTIS